MMNEGDNQLSMMKELSKEQFKKIMYINLIFGVCVVVSLIGSFTITNEWLLLRILLFLNFITFASNMIIFVYSQKIIMFTFLAQEELMDVENEWQEIVDSLQSAGITAKKISKFEPLINKISEFMEKVKEENLETGIDMLIDVFNSMDSDGMVDVEKHKEFKEYIEGD